MSDKVKAAEAKFGEWYSNNHCVDVRFVGTNEDGEPVFLLASGHSYICDVDDELTHLPDCTGWDYQPPAPQRKFFDETTYDNPGMWIDDEYRLWFGPGSPESNLHFATMEGFLDSDKSPIWVYRASELPDGEYTRVIFYQPPAPEPDTSLEASIERESHRLDGEVKHGTPCICPVCDRSRIIAAARKYAEAVNVDKNGGESFITEKDRRIYYQDLLYDVCNVLDKWDGRTTITGEAAEPSTDAVDKCKAMLEAARKWDELERETDEAMPKIKAMIDEAIERQSSTNHCDIGESEHGRKYQERTK